MPEILNDYAVIWADKRKTQCDLFMNSWKGLFQYIHFTIKFLLWEHAQEAIQNALSGKFSPGHGKRLNNDHFPDQEYFSLLEELNQDETPQAKIIFSGLITLLLSEDPTGGYRLGLFFFLWRKGSLITIGFSLPKQALGYMPRGKDGPDLPELCGLYDKYDSTGVLFEMCNSIACCTLEQTSEIIEKVKHQDHSLTYMNSFLHALTLLDQLESIFKKNNVKQLGSLREVADPENLAESGTILAPILKKIMLWRVNLESFLVGIVSKSSTGFPPLTVNSTWAELEILGQSHHIDPELLVQTANKMEPSGLNPSLIHRNLEVLANFYGIIPRPEILKKIQLLRNHLISSSNIDYPYFTSVIVLIIASLENGNESLFTNIWEDLQIHARKLTPEGISIIAELLLNYLNAREFVKISEFHQQMPKIHPSIIPHLTTIFEWTNQNLKAEGWPGNKTQLLFPIALTIGYMKKYVKQDNPESQLTNLLTDSIASVIKNLETHPVKFPQSTIDIVKQVASWMSIFANDDILPHLVEEFRPRYPQMIQFFHYKNSFCQEPLPSLQRAVGFSNLRNYLFDFLTKFLIPLQNYGEIVLFMGILVQFFQNLNPREQQICFNLGHLKDMQRNLNSLTVVNLFSRFRNKSTELLWEDAQ